MADALPGPMTPEEFSRWHTLAYIMLIDTRAPVVAVYVRQSAEWEALDFAGLDAVIDLPAINARLPLADIFEGLTFP